MIRHLGSFVREEPFGHMKAQDILSFATDTSSNDAIIFFFWRKFKLYERDRMSINHIYYINIFHNKSTCIYI